MVIKTVKKNDLAADHLDNTTDTHKVKCKLHLNMELITPVILIMMFEKLKSQIYHQFSYLIALYVFIVLV